MNTDIMEKVCLPPSLEKISCDVRALKKSFHRYLNFHLGRSEGCIPFYIFEALSFTLRDRTISDWHHTSVAMKQPRTKRAYYLSLEYLIGRAMGNHVLNMGITENVKEAMHEFCLELEDIESIEPDAGLGNGGLGRLAACFMDSCATLRLPVLGYGIYYEYGMFRQEIRNGYQVEEPDHWLMDGTPWEIKRTEYSQRVQFQGRTEFYTSETGELRARWVDTHDVMAVPYDIPISGYRNNTVNTLRLWRSIATDEFDLDEFNAGSYPEAVAAKNHAEHISMVLYPNDANENGKELRLRQQYFLASASIQDVIQLWENNEGPNYELFAENNVFQLNDTHPSIAVAELMRILVDEKHLEWDEAWQITTSVMAYTNHTLLPEALERWSVSLFKCLLPRLLDIIYEINSRFMHDVSLKWPGDTERLQRMSIIEETGAGHIRMAYLAIVGSFSINGVAALHSRLLQEGLFRDFYELWPEKFNNKTNGVTPRRWIAHANPLMTELISSKIGEDWIADLQQINELKPFASSKHSKFHKTWKQVKQANKQRLAELVLKETGISLDISALFDIQVKRIHEYKRQLLNLLHVIHLYNRIKHGDTENWVNRCVLIGGKAAPGYSMAKSIIKLANNMAEVINNDEDVGDRLKLVFFPNYGVSAMEIIAPAADLSEQISTAGKEASGTGNMKFMMNGAITIGTYDGANIEILDAVGEENFFLFGLRTEDVEMIRGHYHPSVYIEQDKDLEAVMHLLESGYFNALEPGIFDELINSLKNPFDPWLTLADFRSFIEAQAQVEETWSDQKRWIQMSINNTASSGHFSTDRTMQEYNDEIWKLTPLESH